MNSAHTLAPISAATATKVCIECAEEKSLTAFGVRRGRRKGECMSRCKTCAEIRRQVIKAGREYGFSITDWD